jgi:hypothetical protein
MKKAWLRIVVASAALVLSTTTILAALVPGTAEAAACSAPIVSHGTDTMTLSVPTTASYTLWVRMLAPATTSNSILMQVDGSTCFSVGASASMPLNSLTWVDYQNGTTVQPMEMQLAAGNHSVELIGSETGVVVDSVLALAGTSCVPTGTGTNCTMGQVTTTTPGGSSSQTSSSGTATTNSAAQAKLPTTALSASGSVLTPNDGSVELSHSVTLNPTFVPNRTIKEVKYYLNQHLVYTATKAPFTYYLNTNKLVGGSYVLTTTTFYLNGDPVSAYEKLTIKHPWYMNLGIYIMNHLWIILAIVIVVAVAVWQAIVHRRALVAFIARHTKGRNMPVTEPAPLVTPGTYPAESDHIEDLPHGQT